MRSPSGFRPAFGNSQQRTEALRKMAKAAKSRVSAKEKLVRLLNSKATVPPEELHAVAGGQLGGRNAIYESCHRGDLEHIRVGNRIFILTEPLKRKLGLAA
jgi:hypothetical protein